MTNAKKLTQIRKQIDAVDQHIVELIRQRVDLAREIGRYKEKHGLPILDTEREQAVLENLKKKIADPFYEEEIVHVFEFLMQAGKKVQLRQKQFAGKSVTLGIIGHGRFGKLLEDIFEQHWNKSKILVFSSKAIKGRKNRRFDFKGIEECDFIFPCVPISNLQEILRQLKPHLSRKNTVVDVCSVMVYPTKWMEKILGKTQPMIATHPMFGPDGTHKGTELYGQKMVLHNISADMKKYQLYRSFWDSLGMVTLEMSPEEHDKYAISAMAYTHLVGRMTERLHIEPTPIDTRSSELFHEAQEIVVQNSMDLFYDLQRWNPYAKSMRKKMSESLKFFEGKLKSSSRR